MSDALLRQVLTEVVALRADLERAGLWPLRTP